MNRFWRNNRRDILLAAAFLLGAIASPISAEPLLAAPNSAGGEPAVTVNRQVGKADVAFSLSAAGKVVVKALDQQNQEIVRLLEENLGAGTHEFSFFVKDLSDESGPITISLKSGTQEILKVIP